VTGLPGARLEVDDAHWSARGERLTIGYRFDFSQQQVAHRVQGTLDVSRRRS